jgi:nitrate reductase beta subunit
MFWNNVETKPYGSHPIGWDKEILNRLGVQEWGNDDVYEGDTIFEARDIGWEDTNPTETGTEPIEGYMPAENWAHPNLGEDEPAGERIGSETHIEGDPHPMWFFYLPRICNHCTFAGCTGSCPVQAIYKRQEEGIVLIDEDTDTELADIAEELGISKPAVSQHLRIAQAKLVQEVFGEAEGI